jgi:small subunit ribosomal protein S15
VARIHTRGRGKSGSKRPLTKKNPEWAPLTGKEVEDLVAKYRHEGSTEAAIGLKLRDLHAVPSVRLATGKRVEEILREQKLLGEIPDDLMSLMRKAVNLDRHIQKNQKDNHNKHALQNVEAKIRRLVTYYQREARLPSSWRYSLSSAKILVE